MSGSSDATKDRTRAAKPPIETRRQVGAASPAAVVIGDWSALMQTGLAWLEQLAAVAQASRNGRADGLLVVHRDPQTGQGYLRIDAPPRVNGFVVAATNSIGA